MTSWYPTCDGNPITSKSQGIYRPEAYGTVTGTDPADGALVQAAFDAVKAAGGGTVVLEQTYAYTDGANHDGVTEGKIGVYTSTVGLWLDASNVVVDGKGTGVLKLSAMPEFTAAYVGFLIGNGGFSGGTLPGDGTWEYLEANGTWIENVMIKDLDFDNSVLTDEDLDTLTNDLYGAVVLMAFCRNSDYDGINVDRAWGGGISTHSSSSYNHLSNLHIGVTERWGFWLDGCEGSVIDNISVDGFLDPNSNAGLICATNADYSHGSSDNEVSNFAFMNCQLGIGGVGPNSVIHDGEITIGPASTTKLGISLDTRNAAHGCWWHHDVEIYGVTIYRGVGMTGTIFGIQLTGVNAALVDGLPRECSDNNIHDCFFPYEAPGYALVLNVQAKRNTFTGHTITANIYADVSGGTASDNVIQTEKTP